MTNCLSLPSDPGDLPERVEPETGPTITLPLGDWSGISVEPIGAGVVWLTVAHNAHSISIMLLAHQVDELAAALVAASPVPHGLAEQVDQEVTEIRPGGAS